MPTVIRILMLLAIMLTPLSLMPAEAKAANCEFTLGFKALHDMIPDIVGECKTNEYHNAQNGDGLQETTAWHGKGGLLVWRKADNWTAFTDGENTWVNGPQGLQKRGNCERFAWEKDPVGPPCTGDTRNWAVHNDAEKTFKYPAGWIKASWGKGALNAIIEPKGRAAILYYAPLRLGDGYDPAQYLIKWQHDNGNRKDLTFQQLERLTINGFPAAVQYYEFTDDDGYREKGFVAAIRNGANVYVLEYFCTPQGWATYGPLFRESLNSFIPKSAG